MPHGDLPPFFSAEIKWEFSDGELSRAESIVRTLGCKLLKDESATAYWSVHVDREALFGILQAGTLDAIQTVANYLQGCSVPAARVLPYLRATAWEKLRGYQWRDLPWSFTAPSLRKPTRKPQQTESGAAGIDIDALAKSKSF